MVHLRALADPTSPSNRKGSGALGALSQVIGIDRLSISFPTDRVAGAGSGAWDREEVTYRNGEPRRRMSVSERLDGASFFVGVKEVPESPVSRWWGKVECNPSRVVDPDGVGLATLAELPEVLSMMGRAATRTSEPQASGKEVLVRRLDLARDFVDVEDAGRLIRGLAPVHRPFARRNLLHADPKRNRAETLMVGSGAGVVRLYNKSVESRGRAPEGTVRWEAELRRGWLERQDIKSVADLTSASVDAAARERWEWSAMGVEVTSSVERFVRAAQAEGMSERERAFFVGWMLCEAGGSPVRGLSCHTVAKYRRLQRELGIAAPCDLKDQVEVVSRLDWDSGREVVRVA